MTRKNSAVRSRRSPVRKFNPGTLQSDQEVVDQFVVRNRELDTVLEILHGNIESPSCQHVLIVAPRGRGKTMLLARAAAELRTKDKFSRFLLPVRFMEESHEIFDVADFWLETLFHLARESAASHPELAQELRETHADLSGRWRERTLGDHARAVVLNAAERIDRKLVLMVENLQTLCGSVDDDFGWQLRASLQSEPQIMMLASATSRFEGLEDAEEPFFELFRVIDLTPLTTEECRRLWQTVSGDQVSARDIRPLEILTGGNPRLLVVVASFSEHRSLRALMEELVRLIDEHTEYFRGHLEVLPKSERRVYIAIIDLWQPSSNGEIATRARMDVRVVSTMLGRLIDRGVVTPDPSTGRKKRLYSAAEPLYSIYYKLRRERDEAAVVESLIQFMVSFYDISVLYPVFDRLWSDVKDSPSLLNGIDRALTKRPVETDLGSRMVWDRLQDVSEKVWNNRRLEAQIRLQEETEAAFRDGEWMRVIELVDRYVAEGWTRRSKSLQDHDEVYFAHLRVDAYFGLGEFEKVIAIGSEILDRFRDSRDVFILFRSAMILYRKSAAQVELGDLRNAIISAAELVDRFGEYKDSEAQQLVGAALLLVAETQEKLGAYEAAVSLFDDILDRYRSEEAAELQKIVAKALVAKASIAREQLSDYETAFAAFDEVIGRFRTTNDTYIKRLVASALMNRAFMKGESGEFEGEIESYDKLIVLLGDAREGEMETFVALALSFKSMSLVEIGRMEEADKACKALQERLGKLRGEFKASLGWQPEGVSAIAMMARRETVAAVGAFRSAWASFPGDDRLALGCMVRLAINFVAAGASERELVEILSRDRTKVRALGPLIVALRQRAGEAVRAPVQVLEVAADIRKRISASELKIRPSRAIYVLPEHHGDVPSCSE